MELYDTKGHYKNLFEFFTTVIIKIVIKFNRCGTSLKVLEIIPVWSYYFINFNVAYNGYNKVYTVSNKIGLQTAETINKSN